MKINKGSLLLTIAVIFIAVLWISACRHDTLLASDLPDLCFRKDVLPVFMTNCAISGCHDGRGETGLLLNDSASIRRSVTPGNPLDSRSYQAIISTFGENKMPPDRPLSLENRTIIRVWIEQGAKITYCTDTPVLLNRSH